MSKLETQAIISAKDEASATLKKIAGEFDQLSKRLGKTKELDAASKKLATVGKVDTRAIAAADRALSDSTRKEIAAMRLKEGELRRLTAGYDRMAADRERAMAGIGNEKIRDQLRLKDQAIVEKRLLDQAQAAHRQRRMIDELSGRREHEAARQVAKEKLANERQAAADRLRAARDDARAARRSENEEARVAARERVRVARAEAHSVREATAREEQVAHRVRHYGRGAAGMALGAVGVGYGAERGAHYVIEKAAEMERERARGYLLGYTPDEQKRSDDLSLDLQRRYPSISRVQISEHLRSLTGTFADQHHGEEVLPDIVRANVVLGSLRGNDAAGQDLDQLVKGIEALGAARDPTRFRRLLDSFLKSASYFGAGVTGAGFREYIQNAKTSALGVNDDFLTTVAPTMMQHDGAGKFGTMQRMAFSALVGGRQTKGAKAAQQSWGILGKNGRPLHEREMIENPFDFAVNYLEPGLKKKGFTFDEAGKAKLIAELTRGFSNANAGEFFASMLLNKEIVQKARPGLRRAKGREAAEDLPGRDPYLSLKGLGESIATFSQTLLSPYVQGAPAILNRLTAGIGAATKAVETSPKARSWAEKGSLATLPPALWGAGKVAQAVAGEGTGVVANTIRYGGRAAAATGRFGTRLLPGVAQVLLAKEAYDAITPFMTEFGRIAAGAYWQPKDVGDVVDLRNQRDELKAKVAGIESRTHPSMRGAFNPETDQLKRQIADLENRINSFAPPDAARNAALGIRGSSEVSPVGQAGRSFGLSGPTEAAPGWGTAQPLLSTVNFRSRQEGFDALHGDQPAGMNSSRPAELGNVVARVDQPIPVSVSFSPIENRIVVKVEGPGQVVNQSTNSPVARQVGTSMARSAAP